MKWIKMDFVYICKDGDNEELRYSIRSVMASFPDAKVWVVGGKPSWYNGNFIFIQQRSAKYINAINNLKTICSSEDISEEFVLMNDDFYIIEKIKSIETFHGGLLLDKINLYKKITTKSGYIHKMEKTFDKITDLGLSNILDYELHVPMVMEKQKLKSVLKHGSEFLWRSMYGNMFSVGGTEMQDVKVYIEGPLVAKSYEIKNKEHKYLSSTDTSFQMLYSIILKKMFSTKCKYEN
jgi:hypothetical protein